jgi:hypothetical protein
MQKKFPNFADKFPSWATESNAMHQYAIWVALQLEGLGCNLQHYNPLINAKVQSTWGLPDSWELKAQMVLGTATASPKTKTFLPSRIDSQPLEPDMNQNRRFYTPHDLSMNSRSDIMLGITRDSLHCGARWSARLS